MAKSGAVGRLAYGGLRLAAGIGVAGVAAGFLGGLVFAADALAHLRPQLALWSAACAVALLALRAWRLGTLAAAAALLAAAGLHGAWRAPQPVTPAACVDARLIVATINVQGGNTRRAALIETLAALDADILATQELDPAFMAAAAPLIERYPHRAIYRSRSLGVRLGIGLWSKWPLGRADAHWMSAHAPMRAYGVIFAGRTLLGVGALHLGRPIVGGQRGQLAGLGAAFAALPKTRIILGDFNAAPWSRAMALSEAALGAKTIGGLRRTWRGAYPNPLTALGLRAPPIPAPIGAQIDHILLSPGLGVRRIDTFAAPGSTHRGVRAEIEIPKADCAPR